MEKTISLISILDNLRQHTVKILFSTIIGLAIALGITFIFINPKYSSQAQLIVTLPKEYTNVNTNLQAINTYKDIISSDLVLSETKDYLDSNNDIKISINELKNSVSVVQSTNSQMISIRAENTSILKSQKIADAIAVVFQENTKKVMNIEKVTIFSKAVSNVTPISPSYKMNSIIGIILGTLFGISGVLLSNVLSDKIKSEKFITDVLDLKILGSTSLASEFKERINTSTTSTKINKTRRGR